MDKITRGQIIDLIAVNGREKVVFSLSDGTNDCIVSLKDDGGAQKDYLYEAKKAGEIDDIIMGDVEITPKVKVVKAKPAKTKTLSAKSIQNPK